jgi:branched-chain amino acid transport system permease protein
MKPTRTALVLVAVLVLLFAVLLKSPAAAQYFVTSVAIWAIFAMGFDLAFGVAGLLSFGHAAFFGLGAYTAALLTTQGGLGFMTALPLAALASGVLALLVGTLAVRLSGVYLGLTTLAVSQLVETLVAVRLRRVTGGLEGIVNVPRPALFGFGFESDTAYFCFVFAIFVLVLACYHLLRNSPWGKALVAMRINEIRAQQIGFNVLGLKLQAFAASGAICGIAGALLASLMRFTNPEVLGWTISGDVLIATLLGGSGTLLGPVLGALLVAGLREMLDGLTPHWHGILGVVLVVFTLYLPHGVAGTMRRLAARRSQ